MIQLFGHAASTPTQSQNPISEWRAGYRKAAWDLKQAHWIRVTYRNIVSAEIIAAALINKLPKLLYDCVSTGAAVLSLGERGTTQVLISRPSLIMFEKL